MLLEKTLSLDVLVSQSLVDNTNEIAMFEINTNPHHTNKIVKQCTRNSLRRIESPRNSYVDMCSYPDAHSARNFSRPPLSTEAIAFERTWHSVSATTTFRVDTDSQVTLGRKYSRFNLAQVKNQ